MANANAFLKATGKVGNVRFAESSEKYAAPVLAANWGWSPNYQTGIGRDLNFYPVLPETMRWVRKRYPAIELQTATLSDPKTVVFAPFSLPLAAMETGEWTEFPKLQKTVAEWLAWIGHAPSTPIISGEAAYFIDLPDSGPGKQAIALVLAEGANLATTLGNALQRGVPPTGFTSVRQRANGGVELVAEGWSLEFAQRDQFLVFAWHPGVLDYFLTKPAGPSILERASLRNLVETARESRGALVGGMVYDSQKTILHWQERSFSEWQQFVPYVQAVGLKLERKPAKLRPEQILTGGAWFVFLHDDGIEARHHMDKSKLGLVVPISTIPIANHLFYGKGRLAERTEFYQAVEGDAGRVRYFVEEFLRSDSVFIPTFAATTGMMYYEPLIAIASLAANPVLPLSGSK